MQKIRHCIEQGHYLDTCHVGLRQKERNITRPEILYLLTHGWHEENKDKFEERFGAWNYAIRGKTIDERELRVVVSFDENINCLIITAIDLSEK